MGRSLSETDASGNITRSYVYGAGGELLSMIDSSGNEYWYHYDHIGNTLALTDVNGNMVNRYAYEPFGRIAGMNETIPNPFKYVGRWGVMEEGNGLYYMRARYYDSNLGRFISRDPIGLLDGTNLYEYVGNNPVNLLDPYGLWSISAEFYFPWGGGIIFGKNPGGNYFLSMRGGVGLGGGVSFDPKGTSPGWDPCRKNPNNIWGGIGLFGEAGAGLGPLSLGLSGNAGVLLRAKPVELIPYGGIAPAFGLDWGWRLRAGAATGVELTLGGY